MLFRLLLSVFVYLSLIMSVQAAECRATFADGLTNSSNDGKIKFEDSAQLLNNPDTILATTDIDNDGDVSSCGSANCSSTNSIVPQLNSSYIEYSSSNNLVVDGTTQTISANDYKDVTVKSGGSLSMTAIFSSYHFKKLKVEDSSVLYLTAGDYFVEEIEIKDASQLIVQGSGTARIYIKKKAKFKESSVINGGESGDPSRLVLYSFDDVTVESAASLAGYIYSEKKVEIKDNSKVLGAISSEDDLKLKDNASVSYDDSIDDTDFGSMCDSSLLATPVVNYRFDSCNWADAQNVVDSSANRLDAYAVNGVLSTVGGQVCGLAQFDSADDYVRLPDTNEVDLPDTLTATAWIYLKSTPSGLKTILSKDTNYEFHVNSSREIFWWWNDANGVTRSFTSGVQVSLRQWHHVAITYQSGLQIIYIDGQEAARRTFTGQLITNSNDLQIGQDQGIGSRFFDGDIDEVKIFDVALTSFEVEEIVRNETAGRNYDGALRSCNCTEPVLVDHYAVSHDRSMVSCLAEDITFTAHDSADLAVDGKDSLLQISTSTMKGEWLSVVTGSGVLNNSGNGQATYRFPDNGESSVTLSLSYPDLASDPEVVNFDVTDGVSADKRNSSHAEDSNLSVSDSGLLFSIPDTQSCQASLAVSIQAVKKADSSSSCTGAVAGNRTVNFYSQYIAPTTGTQALILTSDGVAYPLLSSAPGTPVGVRFDSQGEGSISIQYPDAGVVGLNAALTVGQKNYYGSDSFVVFPSLLSLVAENGSGLVLNNTAVSGGATWAAARPFTVSVSGQCANGAVTPNYQPSNAELGISLHTPTQAAGGVGGNLSVSTGGLVGNDSVGWVGISSGFSSGVFEDSSASYSEVGIINMYARDLNYYGHSISQSAKSVGRFVPWFFGVTANSPEWDTHCSSGDFSYMSEDIDYKTSPELVIRGFNAVGGRVYNYGGSLWKLAAQRSDRFYTDQSAAVSATLNSTIDTSSDTWGGTETDYDGTAINTMAADSITYMRNVLEAPFNGFSDLTFRVVDLTDSDGACYRVDSDADGDWLEEGCSDFTISNIPAKELRFGRLSLVDAYGPETEPLSLPWVTEYFDGSGFVTNSTDSCSAWLTSEVIYSDNDGALIASGQTVAAYAYSGGDFRVDAGDAGVTLSAPGAGNTGVVGVAVDLTRMPYFFFDWDGDGSFDDAPSASLIFGQYRSNDRVIFQRQW